METEKIVGTSEFFGEIWKAMLRTPRSRLSAIKYLDKRIPKTLEQAKQFRDKGLITVSDYTITIVNSNVSLEKDEKKLDQETEMKKRMDLHDYFFFYYPNKSKLVINALMAGLSIQENQVYVNRGTLDFLISHMPVSSQINSIQENIQLVGCATKAYTKKDFATLNKISTWLFEHLDEDEEIDPNDQTIISIVESQKNLYKKSMDIKKRLEGMHPQHRRQGEPGAHNPMLKDHSINNPIQILLRIMSDEQNTTEPILQRLSIDLIKFIKFHWANRQNLDKRAMDSVKNLLEQISHQYKAVLESLSTMLQSEIEKLNYDSSIVHLESIDLISFAIFDLQRSYDKLLSESSSKEQMISILSNLLGGMDKISNNGRNIEQILPALAVVDQILITLHDKNGEYQPDTLLFILKDNKNQQRFKDSIESFNNLYVVMSKNLVMKGIEDKELLKQEKQELEAYSKYNEIMKRLLHYQNIDSRTAEMPEWLFQLIECSKTQIAQFSLIPSNLFQQILRHGQFSQAKQFPVKNDPVMQIQRLIADAGQHSSKLQEIMQKNNTGYREDFLQYIQQDDGEGGPDHINHCKDIIKNLWSLLDQEEETERIVTLLQNFDVQVPRIFSDVVIEDLTKKRDSDGNLNDVERAIKRFSIFWKHTVSKYPSYMPFNTEVSGKKYLALHNMINFLEDPNPTLRLSCRSWLSQSKKYDRILDPIIEEFIKNSNFKNHEKSVFIDGEFETQYVIQNFGKLRNIILNTQDEIIQYMIPKNCQQHIQQLFNEKFKIEGSAPNDQINSYQRQSSFYHRPNQIDKYFQPDSKSYLDMLVEITLNFIRAEYSESESYNQQLNSNKTSDTLTVNASACEFMELILKQVEKYSKFSNKIAHTIILPLIDTFNHVIQNKNYAMQVNIINILDLILNDCNFQGNVSDGRDPIEDQRHKCAAILRSETLIDSIINGLKCDVSFVRQKFIKFVEMFVPYIRKFTKENDFFKEDFKNHIEKLIDCFCGLLKKCDVTFFSNRRKRNSINFAPNNENLNQSMRRSVVGRGTMQFDSNIDAQSQATNLMDKKNDPLLEKLIINQEADIVLILEGLQCIINTCLALDFSSDGYTNESEMQNNEEQLDEEEIERRDQLKRSLKDKKSGFFSGLFSGGENNYFAPDTFGEVKKMIYDKIQYIFISCIYCWNHQELLNWNDYHFTRNGMFPYIQEDTRRIQEKLRRLQAEQSKLMSFEENLQASSNGIQRKIISLLRPIAKKSPDQFIEGALNVWLRKSLLEQTDKQLINRSYEKLIQMIVCVYEVQRNARTGRFDYTLPPDQVINSIIKFIMDAANKKQIKEPLVHAQRWTKNNPALKTTETTSETLLNFFLYAYLAHNPTMYDPALEDNSEERQKLYQKVYQNMLKYYNAFKLSRNPFSVCWLLEILNIVSIKFGFQESKLDQRQKKEYHDLFNNMLTNCGSIISDTFNIAFHEQQTYKLAFPPTVYELLWRYDYISYKHLVDDNQNSINEFKKQLEKERLKSNRALRESSSNQPYFFSESVLRQMANQKFEYLFRGNEDIDSNVFKNMEILLKSRKQLDEIGSNQYMLQSDFMEVISIALRNDESNHPERMLQQSKFYIIITLKQILCQLLVNLVGQGDSEKTNKSMQIIFNTVIQILQNDSKQSQSGKTQKRNNQFDGAVMIEFLTEFFATIVERSHQIEPDLIKPYKREIVELFNNENFFTTSMLNLKQWQKIMNKFIDGKPDEMFEEQMQKWSFNGGLFDNNKTVIAQKCYAMKRIAFLIFSCHTDDFQNQLDQLMKKMIEVFKQKQKAEIKQRLFLFFLTRVMLIRLNFQTLTEALRKLWPHLLNELIAVFEIKLDTMDKENTDLTIEAIKLVELLSSLNIEDFQMNQWIFLIDGYGMQKQEGQKKIGDAELDPKQRSKNIASVLNQGKGHLDDQQFEVFKTFIVRFIGKEDLYSFYNVEKPQDGRQELTDEYLANLEIEEGQRNNIYAPESIGGSQGSLQRGASRGESDANSSLQPQQQVRGKNLNIDVNLGSVGQISSTPNIKSNPHFQIQHYSDNEPYASLQEQACQLQQNINDSNVIGNEFNRQEAESKIENDFLENDKLIKL